MQLGSVGVVLRFDPGLSPACRNAGMQLILDIARKGPP